ncbi:hypothetical protein [Streptomyces sp. NPDC048111]|uniref:hypothetical protein n=1 Tax=Streptomyces sp. NPDC048111 TaxID=3365500 RepID=UPI00371684B3
MKAYSGEVQCACHWGSDEELEQLKVPDVELDADLLLRTWNAPDWSDHGAVLRRVLPQFARTLVNGGVEPSFGEWVGHSFARGTWWRWPADERAAVGEFLNAWWAHSLTDPEPAFPAHELLMLCAGASATLSPWLETWEALDDPVAHRHLARAAALWEYDLLLDRMPWEPWHSEGIDARAWCTELAAWLLRVAPDRLRAQGESEELIGWIELLELTGPARWDDPRWPRHRH